MATGTSNAGKSTHALTPVRACPAGESGVPPFAPSLTGLRFVPFLVSCLQFLSFIRLKELRVSSTKKKETTNMKKTKNTKAEETKSAPLYENRVRLTGFLGGDPEQRDGFAALSLATTTSWKDAKTNEWKERTEWHRIVSWGERSESAKGLKKGDHVTIEGELRSTERTGFYRLEGEAFKAVTSVRAWEIRALSICKLVREDKKPKAA